MFTELSKKRSGPSLFEVFIILTVIVIVAVISYIKLADSTSNTRNIARAAQIKEYMKALDYYYTSEGHYPVSDNLNSGSTCIGDYVDDLCWDKNGRGITEKDILSRALVPTYMTSVKKAENRLFGQDGDDLYEGMIYEFHDYGISYTIKYFMEGKDKDCVLPGATGSKVGDDTLCTYNFTP